jgi:hypothetical protein
MPPRLRDPMNGVPTGFEYLVPETRYTVTATNFRSLVQKTVGHLVANDLMAVGVEDKIQEYLCRKNPDYCLDPDMPPIAQQAKGLAKSLGRNLKALASGKRIMESSKEADRRLAICKDCPFYKTTTQRCSKCGCKMGVKVHLRLESCPVGKW